MIQDLTDKAYVQAQNIAPKDTYNLVLNGISRYSTEEYGEVNYDKVKYINFLEQGTKNYEGAKDFIKNDTVESVKAMIYSTVNGQFDSDSFANTKEEVSQYKPTTRTNARFLQNIGGESLVSE